jgi:O-antigen/teichoic acid export membrane protein
MNNAAAVRVGATARRLLHRDRFTRRLATLAGGTAAGQLVIIASSPLLTRLYTPAEIGVFAVLSAYIAILGPIVTLRLEAPILLERDEREAIRATLLCLLTTVAITLLLVAAGTGLAVLGWSPAHWSHLSTLIWLVPLGVLLYGLSQPFTHWSLRQDEVRTNSVTQIVQSLVQVGAQLILGVLGWGAAGLGLGYVLGLLPRCVWRSAATRRTFWGRLQRDDLCTMPAILWRHRYYPAMATPSMLLRLCAQFLPPIIITALYGPAIGGMFGLGQRVLTAPVRMLGLATSQAFLAEAGQLDRAGLRRLFNTTLARFTIVGLLWTVPLLLIAPGLFGLVFGRDWRMAGEIVQIMLPLHLARFVTVPISQVFNVLERHGHDLALAVAIVSAMAVGFGGARLLGLGPLAAVSLYSGLSCMAFLATIAVAWRHVRRAAGAGS